MANSKRKGSRFELKVSKWMTKWSSYDFGRTPGSGSFHKNSDLGSDIICNDPKHAHRCKLSIECKSYKDIKFEHVLLGNKGCDILKFWDQASKDAKRTNKYPILCMRYNSMPSDDFFFVTNDDLGNFILDIIPEATSMVLFTPKVILHVFMAHDILSVPYKSLHKKVKSLLKS